MNPAPFEFSDSDVKRLAVEFLRVPDRQPLKSAQAALGDDPSLVGKCLYAINEVVKEDRFKKHTEELTAKGFGKPKVASKDEVLARIWDLSEVGFPSDRVKALELFSKVAGYLETGKNNTTVNISPAMKVMEVPVSKSDDEWEEGLKKQQAALMDHGTTH